MELNSVEACKELMIVEGRFKGEIGTSRVNKTGYLCVLAREFNIVKITSQSMKLMLAVATEASWNNMGSCDTNKQKQEPKPTAMRPRSIVAMRLHTSSQKTDWWN
ncbi:Hypothetical predicted protein [Olea europaea subsp. europaea]|uniref:Uncharacterized protein n=1 Tax=Olea europaea subsp. europaea TaxID=158383 RepID=A0A8S0U0P7_OLEEU|nr:Hypothetical predicted protein [Olea europaea subsp. europaea]